MVIPTTTARDQCTTVLQAAAHELAAHFSDAALLNRSLRTYVWARWFGEAAGIVVDDELLLVAAISGPV